MNLDIGVIQRDVAPALRVPRNVTSAETFAAGVAQRYQPQAVTISRAELALAWARPPQINYFSDSPHIEISPSLTIEERYVFTTPKKDGDEPFVGSTYGELERRPLAFATSY